MAYELGTWQFDANRSFTPPTAADLTKYQMWYLVSFLLGYIGGAVNGLWTYQGSSDGTTGDMSANPANFKWGTPGTYDGTKIVQVTATPATSAHSWVVLRSPVMPDGGYTYLLIDAYNSTTAGFGIFTSRTPWVLAATATWQPVNPTFTPASATGAGIVTNDATTIARWFDGCLAPNGNFVVFDVKQGSGIVHHGVIWANTFNFQAGDLFPFYFLHAYDNTSGFGRVSHITPGATGGNSARSGVTSAVGNNLNSLVGATFVGAPNNKDAISGAIYDFPFHVWWTDSSAANHYRGRLQDIRWTPQGSAGTYLATGSTIRVTGNIAYVSINLLLIPFNTTLSL